MEEAARVLKQILEDIKLSSKQAANRRPQIFYPVCQ